MASAVCPQIRAKFINLILIATGIVFAYWVPALPISVRNIHGTRESFLMLFGPSVSGIFGCFSFVRCHRTIWRFFILFSAVFDLMWAWFSFDFFMPLDVDFLSTFSIRHASSCPRPLYLVVCCCHMYFLYLYSTVFLSRVCSILFSHLGFASLPLILHFLCFFLCIFLSLFGVA